MANGLLFAYGLSRNTCTRIASVFQQKQRVDIGNTRRVLGGINKDVSQGSILGPPIFDIFLSQVSYFSKQDSVYVYAGGNLC